jgi:diguanylate cyclase
MIDLARGLFINMAIITSAILSANILLPEKFLARPKDHMILNGLWAGLFGCLLMLFSVPLEDQVIVDFRIIPIIIMALYVTSGAAMLAAGIMALFRVVCFGINLASLVSALAIILVGVSGSLIGRTSLAMKKKWALAAGAAGLITGGTIFELTSRQQNHGAVLVLYWLALALLTAALCRLMETLVRYNQKIAQLREEAEKDFLTGLKTPRQFDHAFKRLAASAAAQNTSLSLLYIDIDHFKEINDRYGHACGDAVLKALGKILRKTARSQDIISRKGGEEFVMLLTGCTLSQAEQVAERLRQTVESASFSCSSHDRCDCRIRITLSIGVAAIPETTTASSRLLELADRALYRAKQSGRNRVVLAESEEPGLPPAFMPTESEF